MIVVMIIVIIMNIIVTELTRYFIAIHARLMTLTMCMLVCGIVGSQINPTENQIISFPNDRPAELVARSLTVRYTM